MYESILEYRKVLEEEWLWARHYVGCLDEDLDEADWQIEECLGDESQKVHGATEIPA